MKNRYILNRYRKWSRKAFKKNDPDALMKWKYWYKLYGDHISLWDYED